MQGAPPWHRSANLFSTLKVCFCIAFQCGDLDRLEGGPLEQSWTSSCCVTCPDCVACRRLPCPCPKDSSSRIVINVPHAAKLEAPGPQSKSGPPTCFLKNCNGGTSTSTRTSSQSDNCPVLNTRIKAISLLNCFVAHKERAHLCPIADHDPLVHVARTSSLSLGADPREVHGTASRGTHTHTHTHTHTLRSLSMRK